MTVNLFEDFSNYLLTKAFSFDYFNSLLLSIVTAFRVVISSVLITRRVVTIVSSLRICLLKHLRLLHTIACFVWSAELKLFYLDFTLLTCIVLSVPFVFPSYLLFKLFVLCFFVSVFCLIDSFNTFIWTKWPSSSSLLDI